MQIVIDIPENLYKAAINGLNAEEIWDLRVAIKNGAPLPKGHGRLIDADRLKREIFIIDSYSEKPVKKQITNAPIIIEADGAESEDKND